MSKTHLSATKIKCMKDCPMIVFLKHVCGILKHVETDARRIGSNWHKVLEVASIPPGSVCPLCAVKSANDGNCPLCSGTGFLPDDALATVTNQLNADYGERPTGVEAEDWELERIKLLYSYVAYRWVYEQEEYETVARELDFNMSVLSPKSGRSIPNTELVGKIDKLIKLGPHRHSVMEHKSTSSSVAADSTYWGHLRLDTQSLLYLYIARRMLKEGLLEPYGLFYGKDQITGVYYDVYHKPGINPKKLTQAESKQFVEDGKYCNGEFTVTIVEDEESTPGCITAHPENLTDEESNEEAPILGIGVNDAYATFELGKKPGTFAIKETAEMYGARLLQDMTERPDFYFARKEITFSDEVVEKFEKEIFNLHTTMRLMKNNNSWYCNESHCEATYKCDYIDICYNGLNVETDPLPAGLYKKEKK